MNNKSIILLFLALIMIASSASFPMEIKNYKLAPETIFAERDDDENYIFGRGYDIVADKTGAFYILDGKELCVKKFGADGKFITKFGKPGEGPGEFFYPREIQLLGEGVLVIQPNKIHLFKKDGSLIETTVLEKYLSSTQAKFYTNKNKYIYVDSDFDNQRLSLCGRDETKKSEITICSLSTGKTMYSHEKNVSIHAVTVRIYFDVNNIGEVIYARDGENREVYLYKNNKSKLFYKINGYPFPLPKKEFEHEQMIYKGMKKEGVNYPEKKNYSFISDISAGDDIMLRIRTKERTGWLRLSRAGAEKAFYAEDDDMAKISHTFIQNDTIYYLFNDPETVVIVKRAKLY